MQTSDGLGINCDICKAIYKHDFEYISFSIRSIRANWQVSLDESRASRETESMDVCTNCFSKMADEIVNNFNKNRSCRGMCEITFVALGHEYSYVIASKVKVNTISSAKHAEVSVDNNILEFYICNDLLSSWKETKAKVNTWEMK